MMKIATNREALLGALALCADAADRGSTMPALACVLLRAYGGRLELRATNLNVEARATIQCFGDDGVAAVDAARLTKIVAGLAGDPVKLTAKDANLEIAAGRSRATEPTLAARDFPAARKRETPGQDVDAAALRTVIEACLPAVCKDETRFHLGGVLLHFRGDSILGVATDGHRMHLRTVATECPKASAGVIVPRAGLAAILKLIDGATTVSLALEGNHIHAAIGDRSIAAKLIDAQFPPFDKVIPEAPALAGTFDRDQCIAAIRRTGLATTEARGVTIDLDESGKELRISATDGDRSAFDAIDVTGGGAAVRHAAAPRYLAEAVRTLPADQVALYVNGPLDPLVFAAAGAAPTLAGGTLVVVMPMRRD